MSQHETEIVLALLEAVQAGCTVKLGDDTWVDAEGVWWDSNGSMEGTTMSPTLYSCDVVNHIYDEVYSGSKWEIL